MNKKGISLEGIKSEFHKYTHDIEGQDYEREFNLKGGRGFVIHLNRLFSDQLNRTPNMLVSKESGLEVGYKITKIFIAGWGMFTIEHDSKYDVYKGGDNNLFSGLPEDSYKGLIIYKDKTLGTIDTLVDAPYQNVEDLLRHFGVFVERVKSDLEDFKKELDNLEVNK